MSDDNFRQKIRKLLNSVFDLESLNNFCFDHFRIVYDQFQPMDRKDARVRMLADQVERRGQIQLLLDHLANETPDRRAEIESLQTDLAELKTRNESLHLTDKQKELLRKMVAFREAGGEPYPFIFGQGLKTREGTIIIGAEDIEFDFEDCQALIDVELLRSNGLGNNKTYSITSRGFQLVKDDLNLAQPPAPRPQAVSVPTVRVYNSDLAKLPPGEIREWIYPPPNLKPIPLDKGLPDNRYTITNCTVPLNISVPFKKSLFGQEEIPFELKLTPDNHIRGIGHAPRHPTDLERSSQITPGAKNVVAAYALITAGSAFKIVDGVEFDDARIGYLEFYFEEGEPHREPLVLGRNIRDVSYKHPDVVRNITDPRVQQVWWFEDEVNQVTIDMLCINFDLPRNIKYCQICAQYDSKIFSGSYNGKIFPSIRLSGLTYRLSEQLLEQPQEAQKNDLSPEEIELLIAAAQDGRFHIIDVQETSSWIRAGGKNFQNERDPMIAITYFEAFKKLCRKGYIDENQSQYTLTHLGFELVRQLAEKE